MDFLAFVVDTEMYDEAFHLNTIRNEQQETASHPQQTSAVQRYNSRSHD